MKACQWGGIHALLVCLVALPVGRALSAEQSPTARAAITAQELGVVIAAGDPLSEAIGVYYQAARGIPAGNVIRVQIPASADEISSESFAALKAVVDELLPVNVQATLLAWNKPFRVRGNCRMSITSAFAFGYDDKYCLYRSVFTAPSSYFNSESTRPWNDYGIRPSMMLGVGSIAAARTLIDRGKAADGRFPPGVGYLIRTTDHARSVRWPDFARLAGTWKSRSGVTMNYIDNSSGKSENYISGKQNVLFYFTGLSVVPDLGSNTYLPGAVGDHLTSFGGVLSPGNGQMMATAWLDAGLTGSFGTVEEPYAIPEKFPQPSILVDHYVRGATLIEAYWKSVRSPGEGLFLGEPLARPFGGNVAISPPLSKNE